MSFRSSPSTAWSNTRASCAKTFSAICPAWLEFMASSGKNSGRGYKNRCCNYRPFADMWSRWNRWPKISCNAVKRGCLMKTASCRTISQTKSTNGRSSASASWHWTLGWAVLVMTWTQKAKHSRLSMQHSSLCGTLRSWSWRHRTGAGSQRACGLVTSRIWITSLSKFFYPN